MRHDPEAYGGRWWPALRAEWRDRRAGEKARANARRGFLLPPRGEGKVVWLKAGASRASVLLASELLGALREKRLDIRLALTFELDHRDIIEPRLRGLRKVGLGYGPNDRPRSVRRVLDRMQPFGLILVDTVPHPNLPRAAAARGVHVVAFNTPPGDFGVEAAYPVDAAQAAAWREAGRAAHVAPAADPLSLFVEAQADTTLRSLLAAGRENLRLWWWQSDAQARRDFIRRWRASPLAAEGVLFVSGAKLRPEEVEQRISAWDRRPLAPGAVVLLDDARWTAAVASAMDAGHLAAADRRDTWQALAGSSPLSVGPGHPLAGEALPVLASADEVLREWMQLRDAPNEARRRGDAAHRRFWEERRRAQQVGAEFAQRVFDW